MANDIADLLLRIDATTEGLRRELKKADAAVTGSTQAIDKNTRAIDKSFNKMSQGATQALDRVKTALIGMAVAFATREIVQYADAWQNATNQLKTVQKETESLSATQSKLMAISNESRQGFESTANLYTRLTRSTQSMNLSQEETIALTNTINKSFAVSGASATEASNAIIQLSQGLAAGALRGEEFNSVSEQSPILMQAIADNLKMTRGELRAFAADGGITAEIVVQSLQKASGQIDETFSKMSATFEQNMTVAKNNMLEFIGGAEGVQTATSKAGEIVVALSNNLDALVEVGGIAATVMAARLAGGMATATAAAVASGGAIVTLNGVLAALGGPVGIALMTAAAIYKISDALIEARAQSYRLAGDDFARQALDVMSVSADQAETNISAAREAILRLKSDLESATEIYGENSDEVSELNRQLDLQHNWLNVNKLRQAEVNLVTADATEETEGYARSTLTAKERLKLFNDSLKEYQSEQKRAKKETERQAKAVLDLIAELENEQHALGMTDRAQSIFNATVDAYNKNAAPEQIALIATVIAQNYDLAEASERVADAAEEANKKTKKAAEDAAKATQEAWQDTHDYLSGAFVDIMNNGGNAFDNIAKAFERTVQRMVAEWAASGLMKLFTGGGLSGFSLGGAGGGISGALGGLLGGASKGAAAGGIGGAISSAGSSALAALQAVPGWGWALGGAAAIAGLAKKETPSANAGMLLRPVGDGDRQFDVPAFASGFDPVGFARREDQAAATQVIDVFRADDAILSALAKASGIDVQYSANQFGGFDEKGQGNGLFLGSASEDGKNTGVPLDQQRDKFVSDWLRGLSGKVDQSLIQDALSAGSADAMIARAAQLAGVDGSHANGLGRVPFDGYRAELHRNEEVLTANDPRNSNNSMASRGEQLIMQMALYTKRMSEIIDGWDAIGLPPERAALT